MNRIRQRIAINELSRRKLQRYVSKAVQDYGDARTDITRNLLDRLGPDRKTGDKAGMKAVKRYVGIDRAISKISKKGVRVPANEVKTYNRSSFRKTLGTSSAATPKTPYHSGAFVAPTDEVKPVEWNMEKAIAAAKARLSARKKWRR